MSRSLLVRACGVGAALGVATLFEWHLRGTGAGEVSHAAALLGQVTMQVALPWLALTPLILEVNRRVPPSRATIGRCLATHGGIVVLFVLASSLPHALLFHDRLRQTPSAVLWFLASSLAANLPHNAAYYGAVVAVRETLTYVERLKQKDVAEARLSASLADARLGALKAKLQPHFLFNALHSINVLVLEQRNDAASEMLERLGHLLRISLDESDVQMVSLEQELATLSHYLAVEQIRFSDRLQVTERIDQEARRAMVPNLLLQPIVENAIKHGLAKSLAAGRVAISARRRGGDLELEVQNDGPRLAGDWQQATERGVGLATTLKRLELLFPGSHRFEMRNAPEGGVVTTVTIPWSEPAATGARA